jgi:hypothetical protein
MHMQSSQRERGDSMPVIANNHRPEVAFSQRASVSTGICCRAWVSEAAGLLLKAAIMGCGMGWSAESADLLRNGGSREMLLLLLLLLLLLPAARSAAAAQSRAKFLEPHSCSFVGILTEGGPPP